MSEEKHIYDSFCGPRLSGIERQIENVRSHGDKERGEIYDSLAKVREKVFDGMSDSIDRIEKKVDKMSSIVAWMVVTVGLSVAGLVFSVVRVWMGG